MSDLLDSLLREKGINPDKVIDMDFPDDSDIYKGRPDDIVAIPRLWLYGIFKKGDEPTTRREYEKQKRKVLRYNFR